MHDAQATAVDMVRWSFTANPANRAVLEEFLVALGLDVYVKEDGHFTAIWEEPEGDLDKVVETLWDLNDARFEVTHEEFRRVDHRAYLVDAEPEEAVAEPEASLAE